jgi:hypothetical protein
MLRIFKHLGIFIPCGVERGLTYERVGFKAKTEKKKREK